MSSYIHEVGNKRKIADKFGPVRHAEADIMIPAETEHLISYPALAPEFQGIPDRVFFEQCKEILQPLPVDAESRRKLPEHDLQFVLQSQRPLKEFLQGRVRIQQPPDMCNEPASLQGKNKVSRRPVMPHVKCLFQGKPVECDIQLNDREDRRVIFDPSFLRKTVGIK